MPKDKKPKEILQIKAPQVEKPAEGEAAEAPAAKKPRVDPGAEAGGHVPTLSTPASASAASAWPRWEDPGDEGATMVETHQTMKALVPWLRQELPAALAKFGIHAAEMKVEEASPLKIKAADADAEQAVAGDSSALSSYKESWSPVNCQGAIKKTGMYEAGGNLTWLDLGFVGEMAALLHAEPAWGTVLRYQKQYFSRSACASMSATPADAAPAAEASVGLSTPARLDRLVFPCTMSAYSDDDAQDWSKMPTSLRLLGGQAIVFAWYVAAGRAMQQDDDVLLKLLWQAALTCTIRVVAMPSTAKLAMAAVELSEKFVSFAEMSDTFIHWSAKIIRIMSDLGLHKKSAQIAANRLTQLGIRYRGTAVNKQMVLCVGNVHELFDEDCMAALKRIEREFGRDILSNGYHKLNRVLAIIKSRAVTVAAAGKTKEAHSFKKPARVTCYTFLPLSPPRPPPKISKIVVRQLCTLAADVPSSCVACVRVLVSHPRCCASSFRCSSPPCATPPMTSMRNSSPPRSWRGRKRSKVGCQ